MTNIPISTTIHKRLPIDVNQSLGIIPTSVSKMDRPFSEYILYTVYICIPTLLPRRTESGCQTLDEF